MKHDLIIFSMGALFGIFAFISLQNRADRIYDWKPPAAIAATLLLLLTIVPK